MTRIIGYARVSTEEQASNSHALEQQIARLKQAGAQEIYYDVISGNKNSRKNFDKVLNLVNNNKCDEIIVTSWDRLTRNEEHYICLKNLFKRFNVTLRLLDQPIVDSNVASEEFTLDIQSVMAKHERQMLKKRVHDGVKRRRKRSALSSDASLTFDS